MEIDKNKGLLPEQEACKANMIVRPRGTDAAKVVEVIETESIVGTGTDADPVRIIKQYWSLKGELLAYNDCK